MSCQNLRGIRGFPGFPGFNLICIWRNVITLTALWGGPTELILYTTTPKQSKHTHFKVNLLLIIEDGKHVLGGGDGQIN